MAERIAVMSKSPRDLSHPPTPESKEPRDSRAQEAGVPGNSFYRSMLNLEGKERFDDAHKVQGLDDEIAILRWRIRNIVQKDRHHQKNPQLLKAIELLIRAYSAKIRASGNSQEPDDTAVIDALREAADTLGLDRVPWSQSHD